METPKAGFHLFLMTLANLSKDISICVYDFSTEKLETENIKKISSSIMTVTGFTSCRSLTSLKGNTRKYRNRIGILVVYNFKGKINKPWYSLIMV